MMTKRRRATGCIMRGVVTLITFAYCLTDCAFKVKAGAMFSESQAVRYLSHFGYLSPADSRMEEMVTREALSTAISKFQSFVGIEVTGNMNSETARRMTLPRCGSKDIVDPETNGHRWRYTFSGLAWDTNDLTYKISSYPPNPSKKDVDQEIAKAFAVWSAHTNLSFSLSSGEVTIEIKFERGDHGDGDPFDGQGNVLAHANGPRIGGADVHFDNDENWTIDSLRGINLFQVATHEFGHSLGLSHSEVETAVMYAYYRPYDPSYTLDQDDIAGIQKLYGRKPRRRGPDICKDPRVDTMFNGADGHIYAFKGKYYWNLNSEKITTEYPKLIAEKWINLPSGIDAAFTEGGKTYFFKGSEYWRYVGGEMEEGYPKEIRKGFPKIPDNIDVATVWDGDGKIYFFKGDKYWRYDPHRRPRVDRTYPKSISDWRGLPTNLDAAVVYERHTFFLKGFDHYRFNNRRFSVTRKQPAYPQHNGVWFGC